MEKNMEIESLPFELRGWIFNKESFKGLDDLDPFAGKIGYPPFMIGTEVIKKLNLQSDSAKRVWYFKGNKSPCLICKTWSSGDDDRETSSSRRGMSLYASLTFLQLLCTTFQRELIFRILIIDNLIEGHSVKMMMMDTHHRIAKFLSSQQMGDSETRKRIISLGKQLVEELDLEPGVDTLARWMAHYIAEQMIIAEKSDGDDKAQAEKQCFETILYLWQHRSLLPNKYRPFENFDPIFRVLEKLDPDHKEPYYLKYSNDKLTNLMKPLRLKNVFNLGLILH